MARLLVRTALANLRSRPLQTALVAPHPRRRVGDAGARREPARGRRRPLRARSRAPPTPPTSTSSGRGRPGGAGARAAACKAADGPFRLLGVRIRSRPTNSTSRSRASARARRASIARSSPTARWLSGAPGEVVLDRPTARDRGVHVGQRLTVLLHDRRSRADRGRDRGLGRPRPLVGEPSRRSRRCRPAAIAFGRVLELQLDRPQRERGLRRRRAPPLPARPAQRLRLASTTARRSPTGPRRRPSCWAARASPPCSRSASSSPTPSAGGSSPRAATSACSRRPASRRAASRRCSWSRTSSWRGRRASSAPRSGSRSARCCSADRQPARAPPRPAGCALVTVAAGVLGRRRRRLPLHGAAGVARRAPRRARGDRARAHEREHEAVARRARRRRAAPAARGRPRRQGRLRQPLARGDDDRQPRADHGHGDHGARHRGDLPARHPGLLAARQALRAARRRQRRLGRRARARCSPRSRRRSPGTATVVGTTASVPGSPVDVWARALGGDYQRRPYAVRDGRMIARPRRGDRRARPARRAASARRRPPAARGRGRAAGPAHRRALRRARQRRPDGDLRPPLGPAGRARALRPVSSTSCSCADRSRRARRAGRARAVLGRPARRRGDRGRRAPGAQRPAPGALRHRRGAAGHRPGQPAHHPAARHPRARPRLRDLQGRRAHAAPGARRRDLRRHAAGLASRWSAASPSGCPSSTRS